VRSAPGTCNRVGLLACIGAVIALEAAFVGTCLGRVLYVDDDAQPGTGDGSSLQPFQLIGEGMVAAVSGDTVAVLPGLYSEVQYVDMHDPLSMNRAAVVMKDGVMLRSTAGPDSTTIGALGCQAAVYFEGCGPQTVFTGFNVENEGLGWGLRTGVLCYASSPVIEANTIDVWAHGVYSKELSSPTIRNNRVYGSVVFWDSGGMVVGNEVESEVGVWSDGLSPAPLTIESNTIGVLPRAPGGSWSSHGIYLAGNPCDVAVIDNTIQGKDIGARLCWGVLHGNRFAGNALNIEIIAALAYCSPWEDINAEGNWWGTTDPLEIDAKIVDCYDDPSLESCVDFDPSCLDEACTQVVVSEFSWGAIKALYR
jgi:hypothetical protein